MTLQFDSLQDASMYLTGSFLKFFKNDRPEVVMYGYVRDVSRRMKDNGDEYSAAYIQKSGSRNAMWYNLDDVTFPPQDIKLGNLIYKDQLLFAQRIPVRRASMGITQNSFLFNPIGDFPGHLEYPNFTQLMNTPDFMNMIEGRYPTINEAVDSPNQTPFSRFFSLEPAMLNASYLRYRGDTVGEYSKATNQFTMYKPFEWCADVLTRELTKQGVVEDYAVSIAP